MADELADFITTNKLFQNIQGKEYVNIEAWQYAGARMGLSPVVQEVENLSTTEEIKYRTRVDIYDLGTDRKIGSGVAICSNKEQGRKYYQEYAICSMSQTRAEGKAYRMILAFLIRLAGYEPTPAEEMDSVAPEPSKAPEPPKTGPKQADPTKAVKEVLPALPKEQADKAIKMIANDQVEAAREFLSHYTIPQEYTKPIACALDQAQDRAQKRGSITPPAAEIPVITHEGNPDPSVKWATAKQKEEIIRLLNTPVITRSEKTKMLLNINKLDEERAKQSIGKLKKVIEQREKENDKV